MRLWHYEIIDKLPRKHLVSQFREVVGIYSMLKKDGFVNHCIVSKVVNYPLEELRVYALLVCKEMKNRGFRMGQIPLQRLDITYDDIDKFTIPDNIKDLNLFTDWHNDRYLKQCYYMLEEKCDVKMITEEEFSKVREYCAKTLKENL